MLYERIKKLADEKQKSLSHISTELGLGENSIYRFKTQRPNSATLEKIADYFDVSVDYLLGRTEFRNLPDEEKLVEDVNKYKMFRENANEDISDVLDFVLDQLASENPALMFDGHELDTETKELLLSSLKNSYDIAKKLTKSD